MIDLGERRRRIMRIDRDALLLKAERAQHARWIEGRKTARKVQPIPAMINLALKVGDHSLATWSSDPALRGMEPKEISAMIEALWGIACPPSTVAPKAWRMAREGKLLRNGNLYALPAEAAPLAEGSMQG